ncbi:hypothetical protein [Paludibacterium sp. B53371]|uniref:hypothetical protein n=1 Tax=Paludibacterium sp. B53371 TaxID=2806263 RepID=UPI001C05CB42|nr:hypothetical protein [Paludibacterium sp. B53371]
MTRSNFLIRWLSRGALAGLLACSGLAANAAEPSTAPRCEIRNMMHARVQQMAAIRLNQMADALQLQPAQQDAWQAYKQARMAEINQAPLCPPPGASPVDEARLAANDARKTAGVLADLSSKTSALWAVLTPSQRQLWQNGPQTAN